MEEQQSFQMINPFVIQKSLDAMAGPVKTCRQQRNGCLLVETLRSTQTEMLLCATQLHSYPIKVEKHRTLNCSKEVVRRDAFDGMTEDEIVGYLSA
ncbi:hypothetical protein C0J52_19927 [Blattella germanica]|nr:hypothetical protein C0J52_19927 [Blattella germanica]